MERMHRHIEVKNQTIVSWIEDSAKSNSNSNKQIYFCIVNQSVRCKLYVYLMGFIYCMVCVYLMETRKIDELNQRVLALVNSNLLLLLQKKKKYAMVLTISKLATYTRRTHTLNNTMENIVQMVKCRAHCNR